VRILWLQVQEGRPAAGLQVHLLDLQGRPRREEEVALAGNPPEDRAFVKARTLKIGDVLANPEHGEILNVMRAGDLGRIGSGDRGGRQDRVQARQPRGHPEERIQVSNSGPQWLHDFLVAKGVPMPAIRILWSIGMRESGGDPSNVYPSGAPFGDWAHDGSPYFDTGCWQINNRHLATIRSLYGADKDMSLMLDPNYNFDYTYNHLSKKGTYFNDWGLKATTTGYAFDWSGYPSDWVSQYAADSEAAFTHWWGLWPQYSGAPAPVNPPKPAAAPIAKPVVVQLSDVQPGANNSRVRVVQVALNKVLGAGLTVDGQFGAKTKAAYAKWQRSLGYSGSAADGAPGRASLTALGRGPGSQSSDAVHADAALLPQQS
jgi:hypothetical protein